MCDSKIFILILKYFVFMLFLITVTLGILVLDAFMKENKADEDKAGAIELNMMLFNRTTQWTEFGILN